MLLATGGFGSGVATWLEGINSRYLAPFRRRESSADGACHPVSPETQESLGCRFRSAQSISEAQARPPPEPLHVAREEETQAGIVASILISAHVLF